jgi:hypothetical protein
MNFVLAALLLIEVIGLDKQVIRINPSEVVTIRHPRGDEQHHMSERVKCLIHTTDGKFVSVVEECDVVKEKLERAR